MISRLVVSAAMVLAVAGAVPRSARADWDDRPDPQEFEGSLSPHGYWAADAAFGRVWRPYVEWGWQPYVDGQWIWTSYGWTWWSPEPWGWTFHYGRWGFSNAYGWVWTPGYVWGPAWVDWYWGDGFVGWAPLGPPGFAVVSSHWNYVNDYAFCAPRVRDVVVAHRRLPSYVVHHRESGWGVRKSPDVRDIEMVSRHRIVREAERPANTLAPWVEHRIRRGDPVRERVVVAGRERVIDHGVRAGGEQRGSRANDRWARPGRNVLGSAVGVAPGSGTADRDDRTRVVIERPNRTFRDDDATHGRAPRRPTDDGHMAPRGGIDVRGRPPAGPYVVTPGSPVVRHPGSPAARAGGVAPSIPSTPYGGRPAPGGSVMQHGGPSGGATMMHGGGDAPGSGTGRGHGHAGGAGTGGSAGAPGGR